MVFQSTVLLNEPLVWNDEFLNKARTVAEALQTSGEDNVKVMVVGLVDQQLIILGALKWDALLKFTKEQLVLDYLQALELPGEIEVTKILSGTDQDFLSPKYQPTESAYQVAINATEWQPFDFSSRTHGVIQSYVNPEDCLHEVEAPYNKSLKEEIDRIEGCAQDQFLGHPTHYQIVASEDKIIQNIEQTLLHHLIKHHRLASTLVTRFRYSLESESEDYSLEEVVKASIGGTVIINAEYNLRGNHSRDQHLDLKEFSNMIHRYAHQVLILLVINTNSQNVDNFLEQLGEFPWCAIKGSTMTQSEAQHWLTQKADDCNIPVEAFDSIIQPQQVKYDEKVLLEQFLILQTQWLHNNPFSAYKSVQPAKKQDEDTAIPKPDTRIQLNQLIGVNQAKQLVNQIVTLQRAQTAMLKAGMTPRPLGKHMVFLGNPGTAKTTVARMMGKIFHEQGILSKGHFTEVSRADLIAEYVGQTAVKVSRVFMKAMGGVLFIDEAYSLFDGYKESFVSEALSALVVEMENRRDDLVVIMAGYPQPMEQFLSGNPGLKSRINFTLNFPNYATQDLVSIAQKIASDQGYKMKEDVLEYLFEMFVQCRQQENFGNGRFVRNVVEQAILNQMSRLFIENQPDPSVEEMKCLQMIDFEPSFIQVDAEAYRIRSRLRYNGKN